MTQYFPFGNITMYGNKIYYIYLYKYNLSKVLISTFSTVNPKLKGKLDLLRKYLIRFFKFKVIRFNLVLSSLYASTSINNNYL